MKRVLIAEDDADVRKLLVELLAELGIEGVEAPNGLDAIQQLREGEWDLAVVDLMMPKIDGYVVIRYLEEQRPATHAIVISGVRPEELDGIARSPVVDAVLAKPIDVAAFTAAVGSALVA